jgi:dynactin complex subunit
VETCVEEKKKLKQAINDNVGLEGKLDEANKSVTELKAELQQVKKDAEKKACPGEGIWVVPSKNKSFEL